VREVAMKYSQPVTIAYDLSSYRSAIAYRAMLEYYTHNVALAPLDSEESIRAFLGCPPRSALTILMCHGWGETEAESFRFRPDFGPVFSRFCDRALGGIASV
jgi:hypothetical protein